MLLTLNILALLNYLKGSIAWRKKQINTPEPTPKSYKSLTAINGSCKFSD